MKICVFHSNNNIIAIEVGSCKTAKVNLVTLISRTTHFKFSVTFKCPGIQSMESIVDNNRYQLID